MGLNKAIIKALGVAVLVALCGLFSCSEDEEFTDDSTARLYFSADTISFDTVFTTIGSSTQDLIIYNPNNKGVRLASVRLGSNGNSGFRVNLDGQYNTQFSDVEIYHGDSIFCFIEVTVDPNDSDSPILITDSLLFTLSGGTTYKVHLQAYGQDVIIKKAEVIKENTTLSANRPFLIYDSLVVAKDAVLTIAEGTTLCFHNRAELRVHGTLKCEGTLEKPIMMRGDRTDRIFSYLPYDMMDAQWGGIRIYPESFGNTIDHTNIHSGDFGIVTEKSTPDQQKLTITNSIIHNVAGDALLLYNCKTDVGNSQITNAKNNCLTVIGGESSFVHCTIAQFYPWDFCGHALSFANVVNDTIYPLNQIYFRNSIITGETDDEIYGERLTDSNAAFNYKFENCLVDTKLTDDDAPYFIECKLDTAGLDKDSSLYDEDKDKKKKSTGRWGNFRSIKNNNYVYDFQLDTLSVARGMGNGKDNPYPVDIIGVARPENGPDVGCYQFK